MTTVLASSALCRPGEPSPGWVAMDGMTIVDVDVGPAPAEATDLGNLVLAPALIDIQCNGVGDVDFATADADAWRRARSTLARHGVGAFCPTFVSAPLDSYDEKLAGVDAERSRSEEARAEIIGVHLEGPFLGRAPGAHDPAHVATVDGDWLQRLVARWPHLLRIVTLAPEADPGLLGTNMLAEAGVVVAIGHSTVTYEEAIRAADAGASVVTHLFNGMDPFHHRAPGLVGAGLTDARLTPTVIADGVHLHAAALRIAFACKPGLAAVSDAVAVTDTVVHRDGAAWLGDGTLAGAMLLLDAALTNLVSAGISLPRAIRATTSAPARMIGAPDRGVLRAGARADVIALDARTLEVVAVWLGGTPVVSAA